MISSKFLKCFLIFLSRLRLHEEKVIKDRRHHLKTYPNCFVAKELIDWLIEHKEASDRETAIKLMQKLADRGIIHHGEWGGGRQGDWKGNGWLNVHTHLPLQEITHFTLNGILCTSSQLHSHPSFKRHLGYFHILLYLYTVPF